MQAEPSAAPVLEARLLCSLAAGFAQPIFHAAEMGHPTG